MPVITNTGGVVDHSVQALQAFFKIRAFVINGYKRSRIGRPATNKFIYITEVYALADVIVWISEYYAEQQTL
ncbi:MAG: hypothetical protein Pars2KO_10990 [Parasphingorhabdus sp.]